MYSRWFTVILLFMIFLTVQWNVNHRSISSIGFANAQSSDISARQKRIIEVLLKSSKNTEVIKCGARAFEIVYMSNTASMVSSQFAIIITFFTSIWIVMQSISSSP
ncbi:hypothetical protein I4U23_021020 [Adineta vaga]|nr:hypothetical protein I4U23_021020 [Adineta vaga]